VGEEGGEGDREKKRKEERYKKESWGYLYAETSRPDWDGSLRKVLSSHLLPDLAAGPGTLVSFELAIVSTPP
jgi:hypothetical protein